ncbi:MAG: SH3 type 3 domain protein [Candidatus Woesebacteria bacterium GW2011_GWF1_46_13]|uniref:SH3 type 3 domain protein n=1 Tax=Candidatus Woesebacteria bacterium GW2011_GWF1_46_13 TaxID=1618602 RepID=A0A0G1R5C3_9BACT|nr:MAG: SH3 type 3 domain protein [Candidatus Woesebacteria bacterium GW2011_GWF1_46_13]
MPKAQARRAYYSLGNFIFDQMWSKKTREGLIIKLTFRDGRLISEEKLPIYMSSWAQPEFVEK